MWNCVSRSPKIALAFCSNAWQKLTLLKQWQRIKPKKCDPLTFTFLYLLEWQSHYCQRAQMPASRLSMSDRLTRQSWLSCAMRDEIIFWGNRSIPTEHARLLVRRSPQLWPARRRFCDAINMV